MSDETSTATESAAPKATRHVPDLFNEILVGGPEENPVAQTVAEEAQRIVEDPTTYVQEEDDVPGVEMTPEEIVSQHIAPKKEAEPEAEEEPEADGFDALLAQLNDLAGQALGQQAVAAPVAAVEAPEPVPVAPVPVAPVQAYQPVSNFNLDMDSDTLVDTITDPARFKEFLTGFAQQIETQTMQRMQEAMVVTASRVNQAERLEARIRKEYPKLAELGTNFAVLAMRQSMAATPNGDDDALMAEFDKRVSPVMKKKAAIEKSNKIDVRGGRFRPGAATRAGRPNQTQHKDPTQEALEQIAAVSPAGRSADLMQIIGAY